MSYFSIPLKRSKKGRPTAEQRALDAEWQRLKASHAKPLEKGAKANGRSDTKKTSTMCAVLQPTPFKRDTGMRSIPSLPMTGNATKPIATKDLLEAHQALKGRVGQSFSKGGLQYLSDSELLEQRTGSHRRRG